MSDFVTREMCFYLDLGPDQRGGSKVIYESNGPKYESYSGDVKMVWFIFTREMLRWSDLVTREMVGLNKETHEM